MEGDLNSRLAAIWGEHSCALCFFFPHTKREDGEYRVELAGTCKITKRTMLCEQGKRCRHWSEWTKEKQELTYL